MTRRRSFPLAGTALALVPLAGLLAGCGTQHPTTSELQAVPGATSSYPGSVAVGGHGARPGEHTLVNSSGAVLFTTYCTAASQTEVTRWFASELGRDGWTVEPNPVGTTNSDVAATQEWRRGERRFTLQLLSAAYVGRLSAAQGRPCPSGYRTVVQ
jgi:hypothetical protein